MREEQDLCFWIFAMIVCSSFGWVTGAIASFGTMTVAFYRFTVIEILNNDCSSRRAAHFNWVWLG